MLVVVMAAADDNSNSNSNSRSHRNSNGNSSSKPKIATGSAGYVLEDVPHLTDYIPHLPVRPLFSYLIILFFFFLLAAESKQVKFLCYNRN